ncbi:hypothetical protein [Schaalia sp. ZJ1691]|uniref:hypothetical protein n=1 Tax=Schaalia sp. ZJ1691 TaxID=2709404 RepID=UPI0013EACCA7|nr:hypothetical protein [Schaalia sp. ZJ1691]
MSIADELDVSPHVSVEEFLPGWLEADLPVDVAVRSRVEEDLFVPFVLIREAPVSASWDGQDDRVESIDFEVHTFTDGIDAESDGFALQEAIWRLVKRYADSGRRVGDSGSTVAYAKRWDRPRRRADWAEATGPVQYQDLPAGVERFLCSMRIVIHHRP